MSAIAPRKPAPRAARGVWLMALVAVGTAWGQLGGLGPGNLKRDPPPKTGTAAPDAKGIGATGMPYAELKFARVLVAMGLTRAQALAIQPKLPDVAAGAAMLADVEQRYYSEIAAPAQLVGAAMLRGLPADDKVMLDGRQIQDRYGPLRRAAEQQRDRAVAAIEALLTPKQLELVESEEAGRARMLRDDPTVRLSPLAVAQVLNEALTWVRAVDQTVYDRERYARALAVAQVGWPTLGAVAQSFVAERIGRWYDTLRNPATVPVTPAELRAQASDVLYPPYRGEVKNVLTRAEWLSLLGNPHTADMLTALLPRLQGVQP